MQNMTECAEKYFRISLNLSNFFNDHRSAARLFINKTIKTISDLQCHIQEVFKIENVYLMCDNFYLPPSEDVRILHSDDNVWVFKSSRSSKRTTAGSKNADTETVATEICVMQEEDVRIKPKKKKRKTEHIDCREITDKPNGKLSKPQKAHKESSFDSNLVEDVPQVLNESLENNMDNNAEKAYENNTEDIIVTNNSERFNGDICRDNCLIMEEKASEENQNVNLNKSFATLNCNNFVKSFKRYSGVGTLLTQLQNGTYTENEFVTKRKRKRVRKRKQNIEIPDDSVTGISDVSFNTSSMLSITSNSHIRFDNEDNNGTEISETFTVPADMSQTEIDVKQNKAKEFDFKQPISEDEIKKHPTMDKMAPRIGDVIAFKVLKMSQDYSPEISAYIIGKVITYENQEQNVELKILVGKEELQDPTGKFFLENEVQETDTFECKWTDMYAARLLFP